MMIQRKHFLVALLAALVCGGASAQTAAPDAHKQLAAERFTIVSPFPPGGPVDTLARVLSDGLAKRYGQAAVVENLAGDATMKPAEFAKAMRDETATWARIIKARNIVSE